MYLCKTIIYDGFTERNGTNAFLSKIEINTYNG